jgi:hypothetical protein
VNIELYDFAESRSDRIAGLTKVESGVVGLCIVNGQRTVLKDSQMRIGTDRLEVGRRLLLEVCGVK